MSKTRVLVDEEEKQVVALEVKVEPKGEPKVEAQDMDIGMDKEEVNTTEWERVGVRVEKVVQPMQLQQDTNLTIAMSGLRYPLMFM